MNSINKNQSEETKENLNNEEALDRIKKMIMDSDTCFFLYRGCNKFVKGREVDEYSAGR